VISISLIDEEDETVVGYRAPDKVRQQQRRRRRPSSDMVAPSQAALEPECEIPSTQGT